MSKSKIWIFIILFCSGWMGAQSKTNTSEVPHPKLVVGIVVDQMRWDYLYRYYDKYGNDGFKRMLNTGYSVNNVHIPYIPTYTAVGHTSIFTGSVPAIHGIAGNDWYDRDLKQSVYCTSDDQVQPIGTESKKDGQHSPHRLLATTITDQLRLATNFQGKVVGVSLKDRASILPAGHNPNAAFWFDDSTGNFITSSYYMQNLPQWLKDFNAKKYPEQLLKEGWNTLLPIEEYTESSPDDVKWEGLLGSVEKPVFPYKNLSQDYKKSHGIIRATPFGNTLTLKLAEAALSGYQLGEDNITDFLTINMASTDYVGHMFGPNSIEVEDTYIRLDRELASFFKYLDGKIGKGNYTVFLSADHGGAHSIEFMKEHQMPADFYQLSSRSLNPILQNKFGSGQLISTIMNNQVYLNREEIEKNNLDFNEVEKFVISEISKNPAVIFVESMKKVGSASIPEPIKTRIINGYNWNRSGDIQVIMKDGYLSSSNKTGTTHGAWNSYDSHIPLLFMGWGIEKGETNKAYSMTDIAPTLAALLKIQFPSGTVGVPITEVLGE